MDFFSEPQETVFIMHSGHQIKLLIVKQSFLTSLTAIGCQID